MNKKYTYKNLIKFSFLLLILAMCTSCVSNKNIVYFQDIQTINQAKLENAVPFIEPVIQPDDILSINIFTLDQKSSAVVNQSAPTPLLGANNAGGGSQLLNAFLVDKNGEIELALSGKIKVAGLTTYEARELVRKVVSINYKEPNVQLRFANFKISVLGEVNIPSTYTLPNEKVTILDALSLAGDLTIYGRRDNVLIVRDNNGKKEFARLNLNSSEIFSNSFYYLKQNDVIYVEPNKAKASANNTPQIQTIGVITSILSVLVLGISVLKQN